jgi:hypothetical protein
MIRIFLYIILLFIPFSAQAGDLNEKAAEEKMLIVTGYQYVQGSDSDDKEIGHSLCGTRCNALSANYKNIMEPGGWNIIRISSSKEVLTELGNRLISGHCICIADEYIVQQDDRFKVLKNKGRMAGRY